MCALLRNYNNMTEAEYLAFDRDSEMKHEFIHNEVFAMSGASQAHNLICGNLITALNIQLEDSACRVYPSDMRVKVEATTLYTYPDVSVVCEEPQFSDNEFDTLLNPLLLIEVLSPSTERYDRGKKFQDYRQLPSLREYLLVSQDSPRIERYLLLDHGKWELTDVSNLDLTLELSSIKCALKLAKVYHKVTLPKS